MRDQLSNKAAALVAKEALFHGATTVVLVSVQNIVDNQQEVHPIADRLGCAHCSIQVYDNRLGDREEIVPEKSDAGLGGSYVLDNPLCAFLKTSISLLTTNDL